MTVQAPGFTDIRSGDWIDRRLPAFARPYARLARLDRPIGWWLLLFPGWWSLALVPNGPDPRLFALFLIGAIVMRGAGCTLNDIIDRDFDARVERTRGRPIPAGLVSVPQATAFMALQLAIGAAVLFSLNRAAILWGCGSLILIATYPFMKRITFWPQLFLGINFNWAALVAWAAAMGRVDTPALALYGGGIAWTLGYDTIYAHQDKADDRLVGVKSTALKFGDRSRIWVGGFYALALAGFTAALVLGGADAWTYAVLPLVALHFGWQVWTWRLDDPADCLTKFKSNREIGWLVLAAGLLAGFA